MKVPQQSFVIDYSSRSAVIRLAEKLGPGNSVIRIAGDSKYSIIATLRERTLTCVFTVFYRTRVEHFTPMNIIRQIALNNKRVFVIQDTETGLYFLYAFLSRPVADELARGLTPGDIDNRSRNWKPKTTDLMISNRRSVPR